MKFKTIMLFALYASITACGAGSGDGLNENGQPTTANEQPDDSTEETDTPSNQGVTLSQLQEEIFTPICAQCHIGSGAPQGLRLDTEDNSFNFLVNVSSNQRPELFRVSPENPNNSYIIHKIEGQSDIVGGRMPLGQSPLSQDDIDNIREWIANGAPQEGTGLATTKITKVSSEKVSKQGVQFNVSFSRGVDATSITKEDITLEHRYPSYIAYVSPTDLRFNGKFIEITTVYDKSIEKPTSIKLILNHPSSNYIQDINGYFVDGDNDQIEGGESQHVYTFE